ncbi:MAG: ABC transporter substrate-binding protein [Ruminococcaceae bacterium]|nr:ABC transporter substrate-binding protein [Oscillospiraceae bacterium]
MKKILTFLLCLTLLFSFSGCSYYSYQYFDLDLKGKYTKDLAGTSLTVYNWGEYISDGSYDMLNVNAEFEKLTGIKVNYLTFESNETMYSQIKSGGVSYDIIIPSDYMIERLIKEKELLEIDTAKISNYSLIEEKYKNVFFDPKNKYSVPYSVGMVGIIYNTAQVGNDIDHSWGVLWDKKYKDMTLNFNNPRDAFMTAQMYLGQDLNSTNKKDWDKAADLLKKGKNNLQSYVMDEVYGKMETGEAAIAPYYAGDYLTMYEVNEDLAFFYPQEGTNIFIDSICIPRSCKNYDAALMYINFLLEPQIATANAEYIGYASPNTAVINNPDYYYYKNEILYPDEKDIPKVQYYHDIADEIRMHYEMLWCDVKLY